MNIVLLESLGVPQEVLDAHAEPLRAAGHTFAAYQKTPIIAETIERAKDADILMIANGQLPGEVIAACPNLKFISVAFTGVDHVDVALCKERGIKISNAAGYATQSVAELTICVMISLLRRVAQTDAACREGGTKEGLIGCELRGKTVGIVGTGAIGLRVAQFCRVFGCKVLASAPHPKQAAIDMGVSYVSLDELVSQADIISLHMPLNDSTKGCIDARRISMMKPGALVVNMARGPVLDSAALALALKNGQIAGAAIDVYEKEPPIYAAHPLLNAPNTICTPHIAFATEESMRDRCRIAFDNVSAFLAGEQINRVL